MKAKLVKENLFEKYTIQFKTEAQQDRIEDLMTSGRTGYPIKLHDISWINDLQTKGIVTIKDGIIKLAINKNDIIVLGPNGENVNF